MEYHGKESEAEETDEKNEENAVQHRKVDFRLKSKERQRQRYDRCDGHRKHNFFSLVSTTSIINH